MKRPLLLLILDGWGVAEPWGGNAITTAHTPNFNFLYKNYPKTTVQASGQSVGLPGNEMGNSEVGHLNIGAGKIVRQDITVINESIDDNSFFKNQKLIKTFEDVKKNDATLHLYGLVSDGGIHASIKHLFALIKMCKDNGIENLKIHAITDGRDTDTLSAIELMTKVEFLIKELGCGKVVSLIGRYFAMDRDNRWDRISKAYNLVTDGQGEYFENSLKAISSQYRNGKTDEFIEPCILTKDKDDLIKDGDTVIFFNFRSDRARQMSEAFTKKEFKNFDRKKKDVRLLTFVPYGLEMYGQESIESVFEPDSIQGCLASHLSELSINQLHIAETEKYPHVTYFFNGNNERQLNLEERILIPSPRVKTYDLAPEMSASQISANLIAETKKNKFGFIVANFANADMVGHTGNFLSTVKAVETLDQELGLILRAFRDLQYTVIITADHGNAEQMVNPITGSVDTEHTKNPVPFIVFNFPEQLTLSSGGKLANIAPTICDLIKIEKHQSFDSSLIT